MDSILTSIKKLLNISEEHNHFDADLIMHINTVFMILNQLGVGPTECFSIEDGEAIWDDFVTGNSYNAVKTYMGLKVRLLFDPPTGSAHIEAINRQISELEWRLNSEAELGLSTEKEDSQNGE